ncbi:MAG TPA: hypothetical protein VMW50_03640 [Dehalococcoidia bacterium]|nr:hypothetical protein [Dehalococcoidia bacterium]
MDKPILELHTEVEGWFKFEAISEDGTKRVLADWFPNLITNQGLNQMGTLSTWLDACQVGSGSTVPAVSDTQLVTLVAGTTAVQSTVQGIQSTPPYYASRTVTYRFAAGVATGTLSEVGVGITATVGNLYSRALILDGTGAPTTLTILSTETLDVTYQCRYYVPTVDLTGSILLRTTTHDWTSRACRCTTTLWWSNIRGQAENASISGAIFYGGLTAAIAAIESYPTGTAYGGIYPTWATYINNSFYADATITADLTIGNNADGLGALQLYLGIGTYQIGFVPNIMKTSSDILVLVVRHSWGRKTI